jgi:preprotein translocase subunit SecG
MPSWAKWGLALLVAVGLIAVGWRVLFILVTLHVLVCFVLIIVIMLQSGSAADLAGAFGGAGSQTAFGPRGAATFLSHATTWCAIVFMMTSLTLSVKRAPSDVNTSTGSVLEQTQKSGTPPAKPAQTAPIQIPVQPTQQPAQQPAQQSAPAQKPTTPSQQPPK